MPSPDLSQYVDLTVYDKDAQTIFDAFLVDLQSKMPEWVPREGNTEVLLGESLALEIEEEVFAINRLPGAIVEVLLRLYGIDRDVGAQPTTTLRFRLADTAGHSIPGGTRVLLNLGEELDPLIFATTSELVVPPGADIGTVTATGDRFTSEGNGTAAGSFVELLDAISFVDSVSLDAPVGAGRDAEEDGAWLQRGIARFARLTETLVLPSHFVQAALESLVAYRAYAIDNYNPAAAGVPGDHPGFVTVAVYGQGDVPLTTAQKAALDADFEARAQANLAVVLVDPSVTAVPVTATVRYERGFDGTAVRSAVEAALRGYLNPDVWDWSSIVRRNELIALISNVEGVAFVESLSAPAADVTLPGYATLARAGALTITATAL